MSSPYVCKVFSDFNHKILLFFLFFWNSWSFLPFRFLNVEAGCFNLYILTGPASIGLDPLIALILCAIHSTKCWKHSILVHIDTIASHSCCKFVTCTSISRTCTSTGSSSSVVAPNFLLNLYFCCIFIVLLSTTDGYFFGEKGLFERSAFFHKNGASLEDTTLFQLRWRGVFMVAMLVQRWGLGNGHISHQSLWEMSTLCPTKVMNWRYWWRLRKYTVSAVSCVLLKHGWIKTSQTPAWIYLVSLSYGQTEMLKLVARKKVGVWLYLWTKDGVILHILLSRRKCIVQILNYWQLVWDHKMYQDNSVRRISGDFNRVSLSSHLTGFTQFVSCPTTENKALDLLYAKVKEAYRGKQVQRELKKRLKMAKVE